MSWLKTEAAPAANAPPMTVCSRFTQSTPCIADLDASKKPTTVVTITSILNLALVRDMKSCRVKEKPDTSPRLLPDDSLTGSDQEMKFDGYALSIKCPAIR